MSVSAYPIARFKLGKIVSTPNALLQLTTEDILLGIQRHQAGDWGDVKELDRQANERALIERRRLWSVYHTTKGLKFWLITEADRQVTTVLLPADY